MNDLCRNSSEELEHDQKNTLTRLEEMALQAELDNEAEKLLLDRESLIELLVEDDDSVIALEELSRWPVNARRAIEVTPIRDVIDLARAARTLILALEQKAMEMAKFNRENK